MMDVLVDPLTGLLSRASLEQQLEREIARALRYRQSCSLLLMDIDHFKSVNDAFGHQRGDEALRFFAHLLKAQFRRTDLMFRYGGDEFVVVLPDTAHGVAVELSRRLLLTLRTTVLPGDPPLTLSASIGVATCPEDARSGEALMALADHRHYLAKQTGRGRVVGSEPVVERATRREPPSRLLGRDEAQQAFLRLLARVEAHGSGLLTVLGTSGSGRTRFLQSMGHLANLRGYAVFSFTGTPALRLRHLGALQTGLQGFLPDRDGEALARRLLEQKREHHRRGIVVLADDVELMDEASQQQLWGLLEREELAPLMLLSAGEVALPYPPHVLHEQVRLRPLSPEELRVWVRHVLQWDAPEDFLQALHVHTQGLPRQIERALNGLETPWIENGEVWARYVWPDETPAHKPGNLPANLPLLVGRSQEMHQLEEWLRRYRLITIEGPGGVGKTRLALQLALEHQDSFPDGTCFVPLTNTRQADEVWYALAEVLDLPLGKARSPAEQFHQTLRHQRLLFVLDNVEAGYGVAEVVEDLLHHIPGVRFLLTARRRLHLPGEQVYPLRGLLLPAQDNQEAGPSHTALDLFVYQARRVAPGFRLTPQNRHAVARLCTSAEGSPLLIRLMASWVSLMTPEALLEEISQPKMFAADAVAGSLPGRQTVVSILQSFWEKLSENEQRTLAQLSIFPDAFDARAAQEVADASLFFLDALLSKGYLSRRPRQRFVMHNIMREFAAFRLQQQPDLVHASRRRYMETYLRRVSLLMEQYQGPERAAAERQLRDDWVHIRAAFDMAAQDGCWEVLLPHIGSVFHSLGHRGQFRLGEQMLRGLLNRLSEEPGASPDSAQQVAGLAYSWLGAFEYHLGDYQRSLQAFDQAIAYLQGCDDLMAHAEVMDRKASTLRAIGRLDEAQELTYQAMTLYRQLGLEHRVSALLSHLGVLAYQSGALAQAREHFAQALESARKAGERGRIAAGLNNLANVALQQDDLPQAQAWVEESLTCMAGLEVGALQGSVLDTAGQIALEAGAVRRALTYFLEAMAVCVHLEAWPLLMEVLVGVGAVWVRMGRYAEAADILDVVAAHPRTAFGVRTRAVDLRQQIPEPPEEERGRLKRWMRLSPAALARDVLHRCREQLATLDKDSDER